MAKKYYDNTPIIEYPLIIAELKQQLKAEKMLSGQNKKLIKAVKDLIAKHKSERKHAWNNMGDPGSESYDKNATATELKYLGGFMALELFDDNVENLNKIISGIEGE